MGMTGMTDDQDLDLDWARDLFDRARGAGEPAWTADPPTLARAGDRRRRFRTVGMAGGLAGVVALTTAVAVGLGAGTADLGSQPGPGGAWGGRPLADVFKYTTYSGAVDKAGHAYVPAPAAADLATVIARVDPSLTHFIGEKDQAPHIVPADDAQAKQNKTLVMISDWVDDSPRQSGDLSFGFASSSGWAQTVGVVTEFDTNQLTAPCDLTLGRYTPPPGATPTPPVPWSSCHVSHLNDGSTVASASAHIGAGTAIVVLRQFADGEIFSVVARDYGSPALWPRTGPDPATVVHPTPWSEQSIAAAIADPTVQSGWNKLPPPNADGKLLQPADLGKGWALDTGQADEGTAGQLLLVNGCPPDLNEPLAKPGTEAHYWGPLPNGISGTAYEAEYPLIRGTGAKAMAAARTAAQGGCKDGPVDSTKDSVIPLPAGIGDDAFVAVVPGLGIVSVAVRIGDTILRTDISNVNHVRDQTWADKKPLDLSSPSDQRWLAGVARSMVARYSAATTHH